MKKVKSLKNFLHRVIFEIIGQMLNKSKARYFPVRNMFQRIKNLNTLILLKSVRIFGHPSINMNMSEQPIKVLPPPATGFDGSSIYSHTWYGMHRSPVTYNSSNCSSAHNFFICYRLSSSSISHIPTFYMYAIDNQLLSNIDDSEIWEF